MGGGKHARCFEGICFPSWNWMHFTHNGIKLTILARHQIRVHGCHSYFQGTMNADVEWDRAGTVGTMHEGMKDWGITYNTNYNIQEDYTLSGLGQGTMERDLKAILHISRTFSAVSVCTLLEYISSNVLLQLPFWKRGASLLCHAQSSLPLSSVSSQIAISINTSLLTHLLYMLSEGLTELDQQLPHIQIHKYIQLTGLKLKQPS